MGNRRNDELTNVRGQLAPPPLDATLLRLWHREFDRFPPGYFTPSDVPAMRVYLETLSEYEHARQRASVARSPVAKRAEREEVRAIRRQLISLQRALRMYPVTRAHPTTAGRLAHDTTKQAAPATDEPAWRQIMREAGNMTPN